jgi:hypothetical protein
MRGSVGVEIQCHIYRFTCYLWDVVSQMMVAHSRLESSILDQLDS